jgi:hypothetical protein
MRLVQFLVKAQISRIVYKAGMDYELDEKTADEVVKDGYGVYSDVKAETLKTDSQESEEHAEIEDSTPMVESPSSEEIQDSQETILEESEESLEIEDSVDELEESTHQENPENTKRRGRPKKNP